MENSYGIGVANRYALFLDDESDPLETLTLKEQEKELKKKTKVAEKENKGKTEAPAKTKPAPAQKKPIKETSHKTQDNKREDSKPSHIRANDDGKPRNFKFNNNNENREDRNNRRNREDRFINQENRGDRVDKPRRESSDNFDNRNRDKGERRDGRVLGNKPGSGPRGPRRPNDDRRGKREFDRQSGSDKTHGYRGVKPVDKRDGGGSHNWGSHKDIIEEADRPNDNDQSWGEGEKLESGTGTGGNPPEQKGEETIEAEPTPVEEEPKELTLDEWKAQRAGRSKPTYNIRKAGEGEDPSQWKKMYELRKKDNEQDDSDDEEYDASEYPQRVGRQKHLLDIDIQFNDSRRPGGGRGRGQRSGPRGGNRGNQRGGRPDERPDRRFRNDEQGDDRTEYRRAPKVDDERDFPSLG